jgi:DNA-binding beta-propeller fold protein YncE
MLKGTLLMAAITLGMGTATAFADTVFTANEKTVSVSVIDSDTGKVVDTICLGSDPAMPGTPQPSGPCDGEKPLVAFYNGQVGTHGLSLSPDGKILLVANRISGTVAAIDTEKRTVLGYTPLGREPHLAVVRPDGKEAWVAMRGENYISVLDLNSAKLHDSSIIRTQRMPQIAVLPTVLGPSMVSFTSDGRFAFVAAGKEKRIEKFDVATRRPVANRKVVARFTPFGLVTPNDKEIYLVHKGAGKLSILRTSDLGAVVEGLVIGPRANHVYFIGNLAYISIGGPKPSAAEPDPQGKVVIIDRNTRRIVKQWTGPEFTGDPHGIWPTADRSKLFLGHERGNRITVIELNDINNPNDDTIVQTITNPKMKQIVDIVVKR